MSPFVLAVLVNLLFLVFRVLYVLLYPVDLSPEEAQYWDWSRHPDLSYYSKPPMVAYLNLISTSLLGNTEIGVRITPMVMAFVLSLLVFLFVRRLFGEGSALFASVVPNLFVGTSINSILMTTDAPFLFFWGVTVMLIHLALERNTVGLWLSVGVFAGLSFLSKYPAVFLFPLTLLCFLLIRRDLLLSPRPYVSLIPAGVISFPILLWNLERDFVSFKHVSSLADKGSSFPNFATALEFLGGQLLLLSVIPFLFLLQGWWRSFRVRDSAHIFLTVYSLPVVLFFLVLSLRKEVYANWAGFGYFTGSILACHYLYELYRRRKLTAVAVLGFSALLVLLLHFTPLVDRLGLGKLLPPHRDPVKVMVGWEKLGREVSAFYTGSELVFSNAYQISAELAFYVRGNPRTYVFHTGRMTQYYLWRDGLKRYRGKDAIYVTRGGLPPAVREHFRGHVLLKEVSVLWRNAEIKRFRIYRLYSFTGEFHENPKGY